MATYIYLEDASGQILLEDGSASQILLENSPEADGEVTLTDELRVDTWEFDSPEPNPADRDDINYYVAFQMMDNGAENLDKRIEAIRVTCQTTSNGKVQIHGYQQGDTIDRDDIDDGTNAEYEMSITNATAVTRHKRVKGGPKNLSIWCPRFSGTWDGTGDRDRLDELIIEFNIHGTKK